MTGFLQIVSGCQEYTRWPAVTGVTALNTGTVSFPTKIDKFFDFPESVIGNINDWLINCHEKNN